MVDKIVSETVSTEADKFEADCGSAKASDAVDDVFGRLQSKACVRTEEGGEDSRGGKSAQGSVCPVDERVGGGGSGDEGSSLHINGE